MNDREWMTLFGLIEKAANLKGMTAVEKAELAKEKAKEFEAEAWAEEFATYFAE